MQNVTETTSLLARKWLRAKLPRQRQRCCSDKYGQRYVINRPWLGCNGFLHGIQEETGRYHGAPHESGSDRFRSGLANCYPKSSAKEEKSTIIVLIRRTRSMCHGRYTLMSSNRAGPIQKYPSTWSFFSDVIEPSTIPVRIRLIGIGASATLQLRPRCQMAI